MASLLDLSLIGYFSNIFVILFVFTACYAVLWFKKPFGDNKGINALMSAALALLFIFSQDAIEVVKNSVPWFIIMMIVLMFVLLVTASIGAAIPKSVVESIGTYVLVIGIIIVVINISQRMGSRVGPYLSNETINPDSVVAGGSGDVATGSFSQNFGATIFHPKVLALMLVIIVALFSVLWIGYTM